MSVIGADAVDAAAAAGILAVGPRDLLTPLARERARERGVEIVVATPGATAAVSGDRRRPRPPLPLQEGHLHASPLREGGLPATPPPAPRPPSGALYRRGAPLPRAVAPGAVRRVVVVGTGEVGVVAALRLADADVFGEIVLVDADAARARTVAHDLAAAAALGGSATAVRGCATVEDAGPADVVVLTQPGDDLAARAGRTSPEALLVVTGPVDGRASGFPTERVRVCAAAGGSLAAGTAAASMVLATRRART